MAHLRVSYRDDGPLDETEPARAFAYVGRDDDAATIRATLPFQGLSFNRLKLEHCSRADVDGCHCELSLSASDGLQNREHWSGPGLSGTSAAALRSMGLLRRNGGSGQGVNVVIVDHGISRDYLRQIGHDANYCGGWVSMDPSQPFPGGFVDPYARQPDWHGNMIARNVLRVAPDAMIHDAPLLPPRIDEVNIFTGHAELLFEAIRDKIRQDAANDARWVIVNAWAVADSASEHGTQNYTNNRNHRLNWLVHEMATNDNVAFVFAAGNNGQFGGDPRNGTYDVGPGRSILGANGLASVLTVGAVRTDGLWIGSSSQGPGPDQLGAVIGEINQKPDLCAPSWFSESDNPDLSNTGTSAASALAAGLAAVLWSESPGLTSAELFDQMRDVAKGPADQSQWSPRYGFGVACAPALAASSATAA